MIMKDTGTANEDRENRINFLLNAKLTPYGKNVSQRGNKEGLKLMGTFKPRNYPKHLKTDKDKFIYLRDLLGKNEVSVEIFVDLASILAIERTEISKSTNDYANRYLNIFGD